MADRIDYAISVTAIEDGSYDITYDDAGAGTTTSDVEADFVNTEIGRSLGGGQLVLMFIKLVRVER